MLQTAFDCAQCGAHLSAQAIECPRCGSTDRLLVTSTPIPGIETSVRPPDVKNHTVITHDANGEAHVQVFGPEHIVEGSEQVIDLPPGTTVVIRHLAA